MIRSLRLISLSAIAALAVACSDDKPSEEPTPQIMSAPMVESPAMKVTAPAPPPPRPVAPEVGEDPLVIPLDAEAPEAPPARGNAQMPAREVTSKISVASGESLNRLSKWAGISVEDLADHNDLSATAQLQIGQKLNIPLEGEALVTFTARRAEYTEKRLKRFFDKKGGLDQVADYTVRKGDRATRIARKHGLPLWVLIHYNPKADLNRLAIGDVVKVPLTREL